MTYSMNGYGHMFIKAAVGAICTLSTLPAIANDVVRLTSSGALDPAFNGNGIVSGTNGMDISVRVLPFSGGKVLAGGEFSGSGGKGQGIVGRLNADGSADTNFGWLGVNIADISGSKETTVREVSVQSSLKVIAAGTVYYTNGDSAFVIWRYNPDGSLDNTFGSNGSVLAFSGHGGVLMDMTVLANDKIVAVGSAGADMVGVAQFTANGALDNTFSGDGMVMPVSGVGEGVDYDGSNIVVAGTLLRNTNTMMFALRLTSSGGLDKSFDGDGIRPIDFPGTTEEAAFDVMCWPQNGCFVAGTTHFSETAPSAFAVTRLTSSGGIDGSFGLKSTYFFSPSSSYARGYKIAITNDQKLIVAGFSHGSTLDSSSLAVARYSFTGVLDTNFNGTGKQLIATSGANALSRGLALDPTNGNVVLCD